MNKKVSFGKDLEWDINRYNQSKISQEKQIKFLRNINTFSKGILSFWKNESRLRKPLIFFSLLSRCVLWCCTEGRLVKQHAQQQRWASDVHLESWCMWSDSVFDSEALIWTVTLSASWWPVFSFGTLKRPIKCSAVGPAIARVFFGWRLVRLLAQTNVLNFFSLSLLLSVSLFLSISQALLQWCLRTCPRTLNRLGLSPVSSSNALPQAHACVQKHFTFMHLASAFAVCFYFLIFWEFNCFCGFAIVIFFTSSATGKQVQDF